MAHRDDMVALGAAKGWPLDNADTDIGSFSPLRNITKSGSAYVADPIAADSTHCLQFDALSDNASILDSDAVNTGNKLIIGRTVWLEVDSALPPSAVWSEGSTATNLSLIVAADLSIYAQWVDTTESVDVQVSSPFKLVVGRPYNVGAFAFSNVGLYLFVNGTLVDFIAFSSNKLSQHTDELYFGKPKVSLATGGTTIEFQSFLGRLSHMYVFNKLLTDAEMYDTVFVGGAIQTTSLVSFEGLPLDASTGFFLLDALGGTIQSTIDTQIKAHPKYNNVASTEQHQTAYNVTTTTPVRARVVKFGKQTYETDVALDRLNNEISYFTPDDPNLKETNIETVKTYTDISDGNRLHDFIRMYNPEFPTLGFDLCEVEGSTLDFDDRIILFNKDALRSVTISEDTLTAGNSYSNPENGLLPAVSAAENFMASGQTGDPDEWDRTSNAVVAIDMTIHTSAPLGVAFEAGGSGLGFYVGFDTNNDLVYRMGNGASSSNDTAKVTVDVSSYFGESGTLYIECDVDNDTIRGYWVGTPAETYLAVALGEDTAVGSVSAWTGTNEYGVGEQGGTQIVAGEDTTDYNSTVTQVRIYDADQELPDPIQTATAGNSFSRASVAQNWPIELVSGTPDTVYVRSLTSVALGTSPTLDTIRTTGYVDITDSVSLDGWTIEGDAYSRNNDPITGLTVTGTLFLDSPGTRTYTGCTINAVDTVDGDETIVIDPVGGTAITSNLDAVNITINSAPVSFSFISGAVSLVGANIIIKAGAGGPLTEGVVLQSTTIASSTHTYTHDFSSSQPITYAIALDNGSAPFYHQERASAKIESSGGSVTIDLDVDKREAA